MRRSILITGGSSGLGNSITKKLALKKDDQIYFTYNSSIEKSQELEKEFKNSKGLKCDFNDSKDVENLIKFISNNEIDILVNNAYFAHLNQVYFHKTNQQVFEQDFMVNTMPLIAITQAILKKFRKQKSGKIITILTSALRGSMPMGWSSYLANKSYIKKLCETWAIENAKFNITSNTVSPSFMATNLTSNFDERIVENMAISHPLKELLTPAEVSLTVEFLVNAGLHLNGVDIPIDAAQSL